MRPPEAGGRDYGTFLASVARVDVGTPRDGLLHLLGPPDRVRQPQAPEDWYDECWIYDSGEMAGAPGGTDAVWHVEVSLRRGRVVHLRRISRLER